MQKNKAPSFPIPTEAEEQIALFEWARLQTGRFPELALLYHVPNGGSRNKIEAARQRIASQVAKNAEQAHDAVSDTIPVAADTAHEAVDKAEDKAQSAADAVKDKAEDAADKISGDDK